MKQTLILSTAMAVVIGLTATLTSCGDGDSVNVPAATSLISRSLGSRRVPRTLTTSNCGDGNFSCVTPDKVTGKAYYAGLIVGNPSGLSLGPLLGTVQDPSAASSFTLSELIDFDFSEGLTTSGSPSMGGPIPYPADANAMVRTAHIYFGYMDTVFTLSAGDGVPAALQGTHTIRLVLANIDGTDFQKGDLLYRSGTTGDFNWCSASACDQTTRPTSPLQLSSVVNFSNQNEGNKTIPSFDIQLASGHETVIITQSNLLDTSTTLVVTVNFDMTNGVKFTEDLTGVASVRAMVAAYNLPANPSATSSDSGFTATVTAEFVTNANVPILGGSNGSCNFESLGKCIDYVGTDWATGDPSGNCDGLTGGTFATTGCTNANSTRVGSCLTGTADSEIMTHYHSAQFTATTAETACTDDGGTFHD